MVDKSLDLIRKYHEDEFKCMQKNHPDHYGKCNKIIYVKGDAKWDENGIYIKRIKLFCRCKYHETISTGKSSEHIMINTKHK